MKKHAAFTMIELVMVIVVLGIIASIGAEIVTKLYENYLRTRAINQLQSQTEITLEQIAMRLQYRIKDSVRTRQNAAGAWVSLASQNADKGYRTNEWIGISNESFLGEYNGTTVVPGWSGLIDMDDTAKTNKNARTLSTPGSSLNYANNIIKALTNDTTSLDGTTAKRPALIFKNPKYLYDVNGYYNQDTSYTTPVSQNNNTTFIIPAGKEPANISEQYYLSHTAYTLELSGPNDDYNLTLYYNYQPWEVETYSNDGTPAILAEHVSTFRIIQEESGAIKIKLCSHDNNQSGNFDFSACKEKVIY